jgi:hypothetical protein
LRCACCYAKGPRQLDFIAIANDRVRLGACTTDDERVELWRDYWRLTDALLDTTYARLVLRAAAEAI